MTKLRVLFCFLMFLMVGEVEAKVRVFTFHYNLPELIEIQYRTLKKFSKEEVELIVFNDAREEEKVKAIKDACKRLKVRCIRYKPEWHATDPFNEVMAKWEMGPALHTHIGCPIPDHPSVRHTHVIQYALDHFGYDHDDLVALLDGDCFPIRPFSFKKLLGKNDIVGIRKEQGGVDYLWVVFTLFNPKKVPYKEDLKFHVDVIDDYIHDTGAHTYHYLRNHPGILCKKFEGGSSVGFYHWTDEEMKAYGFSPDEITLMRELDSLKNFPWPIIVEFQVENKFMHLTNSSFGLPGAEEKFFYVKKFVDKILKS